MVVLLGLSVPVAAISPLLVSPVAAAQCSYDGNGNFSGDCYFVKDPDSPYSCSVDTDNHTYSKGCSVLASKPSNAAPPGPLPSPTGPIAVGGHYWSPTDEGHCDPYQGGYYCPLEDGITFDPRPGYSCDYQQVNGHWACKTPVLPHRSIARM